MSISLQTNVTSLFAEQALNQNTTLEGQAIRIIRPLCRW